MKVSLQLFVNSLVAPLFRSLRYPISFFLVLSACLTCVAHAAEEMSGSEYESELLEIMHSVQIGKLDSALNLTEEHLQNHPKSRVGYLIKADILSSMYSELPRVGAQVASSSSVLRGLMHQLKNRWEHDALAQPQSNELFPSSLLDMGKHQHVLVADMTMGRLFLYRNSVSGPALVDDYYMSVGSAGYGKQVEGDNKTPVGVYSINQYIEPGRLPDLYGDGAFPVNYPNRIDKYRKRTGYGIWLHGTPSETYARSPWASEGCFVLSNVDLNNIAQFIDVEERTPVILSGSIAWITQQELMAKRELYLEIMQGWKDDWQSLNVDSYLAHYSKDKFNLGLADYQKWARQKEIVSRNKKFVEIDLEIDSLFVYPGEQDMFVVSFHQSYVSNNYRSESQKQQYWQKQQDGQWRIIYEG